MKLINDIYNLSPKMLTNFVSDSVCVSTSQTAFVATVDVDVFIVGRASMAFSVSNGDMSPFFLCPLSVD